MGTSIYSTHKPSSGGGGDYLKIEDGETARIHIASEPAIFQTESQPDENGKTRISTRYGWVVYTRAVGPADNMQEVNAAQIWQGSATFFKQLAVLAQDDDYGDPQGYDIKIKRVGQKLETTYTITPTPTKSMLGVEEMNAVKEIDLLGALSASPFSQNVLWLSDFENPQSVAQIPGRRPDTVVDDFDPKKEISLDDIPY